MKAIEELRGKSFKYDKMEFLTGSDDPICSTEIVVSLSDAEEIIKRLVKQETKEFCEWRLDNDGVYHTQCKEAFYFDTGTAKENGAKYCQYCSLPIKTMGEE